MKRHQWNSDDACKECGLQRSGYTGGRSGATNYYAADGRALRSAGPCIPGPPMLVETALRRAAARAGQ